MNGPRILNANEWPAEIMELSKKTGGMFFNYWDSRVSWRFNGSNLADLIHIVTNDEPGLYDMEFYLNGDLGATLKFREEAVHPGMFQDYFEHITKIRLHY